MSKRRPDWWPKTLEEYDEYVRLSNLLELSDIDLLKELFEAMEKGETELYGIPIKRVQQITYDRVNKLPCGRLEKKPYTEAVVMTILEECTERQGSRHHQQPLYHKDFVEKAQKYHGISSERQVAAALKSFVDRKLIHVVKTAKDGRGVWEYYLNPPPKQQKTLA